MANQNPISVSGISMSYGNKRVLSNIYLDIEEGQLCGLIGPNGAGKSTLMKVILGLEEPDTGEVKIYGEEIKEKRKTLAYIPQRDEVDWSFPANVLDIVLMGRYPHKKLLSRLDKKDKSIAMDSLEKLGISHLKDRQIGQLSGGQQQRVFIARALCQQAQILLLDEPFVGIDIATEERIINILKELASEGKTLIVVHHDLATVKDYFSGVILLNHRIVSYGQTEEVFTEKNISKTYGAQPGLLFKGVG